VIGFIITADEEEREKKEEGKVSVEEFCRVVGEFGGPAFFRCGGASTTEDGAESSTRAG